MTINVYCDGGSRGNPGPGASAFVVYDKKGALLGKGGKNLGRTTNNVAEYNAVIEALSWVFKNAKTETEKNKFASRGPEVRFFLDSQLVVNQLTGKFRIKNKDLINLAAKIKTAERNFSGRIEYFFIPRSKNKVADMLVNRILDA
ncbi:MAG: ribonuclease HI family protein [bacterium]|nr:ribonuclease HI family protein [bacterium]